MSHDRLLKVDGAGNDFLVGLGAWRERLLGDPALIRRLCDRRHGIGADGAVAMAVDRAAARIVVEYMNADGSSGRFCGNATRCAARVAVELYGVDRCLVVVTGWGEIAAKVVDQVVSLELPEPDSEACEVELETAHGLWTGRFLELGVPHLVVEVSELATFDIRAVAPALRNHQRFAPEGCNVSFIERRTAGEIAIRTWERGVEDETWACGSAAVTAGLLELAATGRTRLVVRPRSGERLEVEALGAPPRCASRLSGPARIVAEVTPTVSWLTVPHHR